MPSVEKIIIRYELERTAESADVTYSTPNGSAQEQGIDVPMIMKESGETGLELTGF